MTKLYLTQHARQKLRYYVEQCKEEISGFGKLEVSVVEGVRYFIMTDLVIFTQVCTGAHSMIDDDALGKFLYEKTKAGEDLTKWKIWWHSHATMTAFFSGTDTGTIEKSTEFPYLISLVTNHAGDIKCRLDVFDPIRYHEDLQVETLPEENEELKLLCAKEIEQKVTTSRDIIPQRYNSHDNHNMGYGSHFRSVHREVPKEGSKRWRKLKHQKQCLTRGDPGYDFDTAEFDVDLEEFVNYKNKKPISTSNGNRTSIIPQRNNTPFPLSESGISDPRSASDLDDSD